MPVDTLQRERVRTELPPPPPSSGDPSPRGPILIVAIVVLMVVGLMGFLLGRGVAPTKTETVTNMATQTAAPPADAVDPAAPAQVAPKAAVPTTKSVTLTKEADQAEAVARGELYTPLFAQGRVARFGPLV